jgi:hypothetical protein
VSYRNDSGTQSLRDTLQKLHDKMRARRDGPGEPLNLETPIEHVSAEEYLLRLKREMEKP